MIILNDSHAVKKQILLWTVTVFLNALFTKHMLVQLLINITMVLVKTLSKNVTIIIIVLLEINLVKRTLNFPSKYGNGKRINWNIAMKSQKYVCGSRKCHLCICEKLLISIADPNVLLNKRDELVSKCRHRNKFTLKCFKDR